MCSNSKQQVLQKAAGVLTQCEDDRGPRQATASHGTGGWEDGVQQPPEPVPHMMTAVTEACEGIDSAWSAMCHRARRRTGCSEHRKPCRRVAHSSTGTAMRTADCMLEYRVYGRRTMMSQGRPP